MNKNLTAVFWINRHGKEMRHALIKCTLNYARNWWRESILECQGILSVDEKRASKLQFLKAENVIRDKWSITI